MILIEYVDSEIEVNEIVKKSHKVDPHGLETYHITNGSTSISKR